MTAERITTAAERLRVAMLGTADGGFIDPESDVPAGEMYRLAVEALPDLIAETEAPRARVSAAVAAERARQDELWGEQNHPDGTGPAKRPLDGVAAMAGTDMIGGHFGADLAARATAATNAAAKGGHVTFADILLEEVFEALAEDDPVKLRAELVQVAAVAQQWAEAIDRREVPRD